MFDLTISIAIIFVVLMIFLYLVIASNMQCISIHNVVVNTMFSTLVDVRAALALEALIIIML